MRRTKTRIGDEEKDKGQDEDGEEMAGGPNSPALLVAILAALLLILLLLFFFLQLFLLLSLVLLLVGQTRGTTASTGLPVSGPSFAHASADPADVSLEDLLPGPPAWHLLAGARRGPPS